MVPESWEQTSGWPLTSRGEAPAGRTIELLASDNEERQRSKERSPVQQRSEYRARRGERQVGRRAAVGRQSQGAGLGCERPVPGIQKCFWKH